jgi:hypothetical protein
MKIESIYMDSVTPFFDCSNYFTARLVESTVIDYGFRVHRRVHPHGSLTWQIDYLLPHGRQKTQIKVRRRLPQAIRGS